MDIEGISEAVLVVAHPDDEVLWFSSLLSMCETVVVCFGRSATSRESWDPGRAELIDSYPLGHVRFLKIPESGAYGKSDWVGPYDPEKGLRLRRANLAYEANREEIIQRLRPALQGKRLVITHNPWGEYGNEEHVLVARAVMTLRSELGFDLLVNGYVSNLSSKLMQSCKQLIIGPPLVLKTDVPLATELKTLYLRYNCWTFYDDYVWPEWEAFYRVTSSDGFSSMASYEATATPPLTYINHKFLTSRVPRALAGVVPDSIKNLLKRMMNRR